MVLSMTKGNNNNNKCLRNDSRSLMLSWLICFLCFVLRQGLHCSSDGLYVAEKDFEQAMALSLSLLCNFVQREGDDEIYKTASKDLEKSLSVRARGLSHSDSIHSKVQYLHIAKPCIGKI